MSLKDRIFNLLKGTYGLDAETIADRLAVPAAEVREAVGEMMAEERLWETSEGKHRCVLPPPPWLEPLRESLYCEGWPGLAYFFVPEDFHLELYPAPFIREGEEAGGICFMSDWHVDVGALLGLFDGCPSVIFGAGSDGTSLSVEGTIHGVDAWVEIRDRPPEDIPPDLLMTSDGGFRGSARRSRKNMRQGTSPRMTRRTTGLPAFAGSGHPATINLSPSTLFGVSFGLKSWSGSAHLRRLTPGLSNNRSASIPASAAPALAGAPPSRRRPRPPPVRRRGPPAAPGPGGLRGAGGAGRLAPRDAG